MSGGGTAVKSQRPLDWLNLFLADVKDGLGLFLAIYLLSSRHWNPGEIGVVVARAPFGALIDWTRWKRALIVIAAVTVAVGAVAMSLFPNFWVVAAAQGAASACWGLGAALSNSVAGFIVDKAGFSPAFLVLAGCAFAACLLLWIAMPETGDPKATPVAERNHPKAPALAG
jgi:predicted MFS family arabinose efflux permease